ncbi:MAG: hypothetical protein KIT14_23810 [bacterium]|nr:hypothetical protein [bacterium]
MPTRPRHPRVLQHVTIAVFAVALVVPIAVNVFGRSGFMAENRRPEPPPTFALDLDTLAQFPAAFERWFGDRFGLRDVLVRLHARLLVQGLRVSPSPSVVLGRDGWMYLATDYTMIDYRRLAPFPRPLLTRWVESLEGADRWLRARGSRLVVVIAPNGQTIYPEYVPRSYNRLHRPSRLGQLARHLASSPVEFVDLRRLLRDAKARERVWHMTDSHWNDRGAFVASQAVIERVRTFLPAVPPLGRDAYEAREALDLGGDLTGMLGLRDVLLERHQRLIPRRPPRARPAEANVAFDPGKLDVWAHPSATEIDDPAAPRAVMFRDSFGTAMMPFLSERFRRIVYVTGYRLDPEIIARERPDVVILEIVERRLLVVDPVEDVARAQMAPAQTP